MRIDRNVMQSMDLDISLRWWFTRVSQYLRWGISCSYLPWSISARYLTCECGPPRREVKKAVCYIRYTLALWLWHLSFAISSPSGISPDLLHHRSKSLRTRIPTSWAISQPRNRKDIPLPIKVIIDITPALSPSMCLTLWTMLERFMSISNIVKPVNLGFIGE